MTYPVQDRFADPYPTVVFIKVTYDDGSTGTGSGVIVGANDILTASHALYRPGKQFSKIDIYTNYDPANPGNPIASITSTPVNNPANPDGTVDGYIVDTANIAGGDGISETVAGSELDLVVLGVNKDLSQFGFMWVDPAYQPTPTPAFITGYPGKYGTNLVEDAGVVFDDKIDYFIHINDLESNPGNSGGPIWHYDGIFPSVVGIVSTVVAAHDLSYTHNVIYDAMRANNFLINSNQVVWVGTDKNETQYGVNSDDILNGGGGSDAIFAGEGNDIVRGGRGNFVDKLSGQADNDRLFGEDGNDILEGGYGDDFVVGGKGDDVIYGNLIIDNLVFPVIPSDNDTLSGGDGNDTIYGYRGNDILSGGIGINKMYGGDGNDTYYSDGTDMIVELDGQGFDIVYATKSGIVALNIEEFHLLGGTSATGNTQNNTLIGNSVRNIIDGKAGADAMQGSHGDDTYYVDDTNDVVIESNFVFGGFDDVISTVSYVLPDLVEKLTLASTAVSGTGNGLNNYIVGNAAINILNGLDGNDVLDGGAKADQLAGGKGDDIYWVDDFADVVTEKSGEGIDTIQTSVTRLTLESNVENVVLMGTAALSAFGNAANNKIVGNTAINLLEGSSGSDTLNGGKGNDFLTGGADSDLFQFSPGNGSDVVTDFNVTEDKIDLSYLTDFGRISDLTMTQVGTDTGITLSTGNKVTLQNVTKSNLTSQNFVFARGDGSHFDLVYGPVRASAEAEGDVFAPEIVALGEQQGSYNYAIHYAVDRAFGVDKDSGGNILTKDYVYLLTSSYYALDIDDKSLWGEEHSRQVVLPGSAIADFDATLNHSDFYALTYRGSGEIDNKGVPTFNTNVVDSFAENIHANFEGILPSIAAIGSGKFALTWTSSGTGIGSPQPLSDGNGQGILLRIIDANGTLTAPIVVNTSKAGNQFESEIASNTNGDFTVVWIDQFLSVRFQRFSAAGAAVGGETTVNSQAQTNARDADVKYLDNGNFIVYWTAFDHPLKPGEFGTFARLYSPSGAALSSEFAIVGGNGSQPSIASIPDGGFVAAWTEYSDQGANPGNDIRVQLYSAAGAALGGSFIVNTPLAGDQASPSIAYIGGDYIVVAWQNDPGAPNLGTTVYSQILKLTTSPTDSMPILSSAGIDPTVQKFFKGATAADKISGGVVDEIIDGSSGNDILTGNAGTDLLIGGDGIDSASYATASGGVTVNLSTGMGEGSDAEGDQLTGIENIIGGSGNDQLTGDANANRLEGGSGDDQLIGLLGADTLVGGAGFDLVSYELSATGVTVDLSSAAAQKGGDAEGDKLTTIENVIGSNFNDSLKGSKEANEIFGGDGDDIISGGDGADKVDGGDGTDTISYSSSKASITVDLQIALQVSAGDANGDQLLDIENIIGSGLADRISGSNDANRIDGGAGDDTINGLDGADTLLGGVGIDTINGGEGDDIILGGTGPDKLDGGNGIDTISYEGCKVAVTISLIAGQASAGVGGDAAGDLISNFENAIGGSGADVLSGDLGSNILSGGSGNDVLIGRGGKDVLIGGDGIDTVSYVLAVDSVLVSLGEIEQILLGEANGDWLYSIENLIGSKFTDELTGNFAANVIDGGAGLDTIEGMGGADKLIGGGDNDLVTYQHSPAAVTVDLRLKTAQKGGDAQGDIISGFGNLSGSEFNDILTGDSGDNGLVGRDGDDLLSGGIGADSLFGLAGSDTASYATAAKAVTINLTIVEQSGTSDENGDKFYFIDNVIGSSYDDTITGDANDNVIEGGLGSDVLAGGEGAETLGDTVSYASAKAGVTVILSVTTQQDTKGGGKDTITNFENIRGSAKNDTLIGDSNNNRFDGAAGNDTLTGAGGNDTFVFGTGFGKDRITDFSYGAGVGDVISFTDGLFDDFADLVASAAQVGGNTVITLDAANTITLTSVQKVMLNVDDFVFA